MSVISHTVLLQGLIKTWEYWSLYSSEEFLTFTNLFFPSIMSLGFPISATCVDIVILMYSIWHRLETRANLLSIIVTFINYNASSGSTTLYFSLCATIHSWREYHNSEMTNHLEEYLKRQRSLLYFKEYKNASVNCLHLQVLKQAPWSGKANKPV